jgi:hypothetical protein
MDPLTGSAGHDLITFGVLRYIVGHKALDPVAGVRAAVEKRRHRSTEVWSHGQGGRTAANATLAVRPDLARLRQRLVPRDDRVTLQKCHTDKRAKVLPS